MTERLDPLYQGCESNRQKWQEMAEKQAAEREEAEAEAAAAKEQNKEEDKEGKKDNTETGAVADTSINIPPSVRPDSAQVQIDLSP